MLACVCLAKHSHGTKEHSSYRKTVCISIREPARQERELFSAYLVWTEELTAEFLISAVHFSTIQRNWKIDQAPSFSENARTFSSMRRNSLPSTWPTELFTRRCLSVFSYPRSTRSHRNSTYVVGGPRAYVYWSRQRGRSQNPQRCETKCSSRAESCSRRYARVNTDSWTLIQ